MTDEELIAILRMQGPNLAADRIEALVIENTMLRQTHARAERLEAALQGAAIGLEWAKHHLKRYDAVSINVETALDDARAALKGADHE